MFAEHSYISVQEHTKASNNLTIVMVCVALCVLPQIHRQHFQLEKKQMMVVSQSLPSLPLAELVQHQSTVPPVSPAQTDKGHNQYGNMMDNFWE